MSFTLPNENGLDEKELYLNGKLGPQVAHKICRGMNYAEGEIIRGLSQTKKNNVLSYHLKPVNKNDQRFCMKVFAEIVDGKDLHADQISEIKVP